MTREFTRPFQANIIIVCDNCLDELSIPNKELTKKMLCEPTIDYDGWQIPSLTLKIRERDTRRERLVERPASDIRSLCPRCSSGGLVCPSCKAPLVKRKNTGEGVKHCTQCNRGWFILKTSDLHKSL